MLEEKGLLIEVAHNQIIVYFKSDVTKEQLSEFLTYLTSLKTKVIGQNVDSVIRKWQLAVDEPEKLQEIKNKINEHPFVRDAWLNEIGEIF